MYISLLIINNKNKCKKSNPHSLPATAVSCYGIIQSNAPVTGIIEADI